MNAPAATPPPPRRDRSHARLMGAAALTIAGALGWLSRWGDVGPAWFRVHGGDALWTAAWALALRVALPRAAPWRLAAAAFAIACIVELSQLCGHPWLQALRATAPGALLLGHGFLWVDFPRYAAGAALAWAALAAMARRQ